MTSKQIQIHGAKAIVRAHQIELPIQRQIAEHQRPKFPERNETSHRVVVFGLWNIHCLEIGAIRIGRAGAR